MVKKRGIVSLIDLPPKSDENNLNFEYFKTRKEITTLNLYLINHYLYLIGGLFHGDRDKKQIQHGPVYEEIDNFVNVLYESGSTLGLQQKNGTNGDVHTNASLDGLLHHQTSINSNSAFLTDSGISASGNHNKSRPFTNPEHVKAPQLQRSLSNDDEYYNFDSIPRGRGRADYNDNSFLIK